MKKDYNPDDIRNIEKRKNQEVNEAQSAAEDIYEELDNKYDIYLKENQSPDYKFAIKDKKEIDFREFQTDKQEKDLDIELDNKYSEYVKNGKEFSYQADNLKKTDD